MTREEVKHIIITKQLTNLSDESKYEILEEYFYYQDETEVREDIELNELPKLSDYVIHLLVNNEKPKEINHQDFELFYLEYLKSLLYGSTNIYLINKLKEIADLHLSDLTGEKECLDSCPCCEYLTIHPGEEGLCQICPVCFWENFGEGPNGMILKQAKSNFKQYGVMDLQFKKSIDLEGAIKYEKRNSKKI